MREAPSRLRRLLSYEKGFLLWLPSTLVAAALVLFAIHQVPTAPRALQSQHLRVVLGPVEAPVPLRGASEAFANALQRGLGEQLELELVDPQRVRQRFATSPGADTPDVQAWIRATRSFDVVYFLAARFATDAPAWSAELHVWEVAGETRVHSLRARAATPEELGRALADSAGVAIHRPAPHAQASR